MACWLTHVAAYSVLRERLASQRINGSSASDIRVSDTSMRSITARVTASCTTRVSSMGRLDSTMLYWFKSEMDRETIWPVTMSSWPGPSRRCRVRRISVRSQCWELVANRPAVTRRMKLKA